MKLLLLIIAGILATQTFASVNTKSDSSKKTQEDEIRQALLKLNSLNAKELNKLGEKNNNSDVSNELVHNQINNTNLNLKK